MSSFSDNQQPSSSQFYPPQSAQPHNSIFGGPSSDADPPPSSLPEPIRRSRGSLFGGPSGLDIIPEQDNASGSVSVGDIEAEEDDFDLIMRERPLDAYYGSDGDSFRGSDGGKDEDGGQRQSELDSGPRWKLKQPILPSSPVEIRSAPVATTYVLDRGLDLPARAERPNRWDGPRSTYRRLTADDRGAYEAILTNRARDLAAHLYNAYTTRTRRNHARDAHQDPQEPDGQERIFPPRRWIAWPRPATDVPRPDETIRRQLEGPDSIRMPPDLRPSSDLEESIVAAMMKQAKQTFMARDWDLEEVKVKRMRRVDDPDGMKDEDMKDYDDEKEDDPLPDAVPLQPVVQADDGASRQQLRPLSRNVITQVDRLLMGLHHSVKSRFHDDESGSDSEGEVDDTDYDETSRSRSRRASGSRSRSRGRKRVRRNSTHSQTSSHCSGSVRSSTAGRTLQGSVRSTSRSRGRSRTSRGSSDVSSMKYRFGLRDWSEVMGLAAMMGLPDAAVMRASKRCADLFEQDMTFHTFHEGQFRKVSRLQETPRSGWEWEYRESDSDTEVLPEPEQLSPPPGPAPDPGPSPRKRKSNPRVRSQSESQSRRHRSTSAATPAASTIAVEIPNSVSVPALQNQTDSESQPQLPQVSQIPQVQQMEQAPRGKGKHRKNDLVCPIKRCSRHTNGFSRTWNLNLHMKRVHPGYTPGDRERSRSQSTPGGVELIEID
ncbi:hypothetical protein PMG11_01733 [Penicillium brasilianum]|uniref:Uncharacterized protein n=1 Tax=Penicillium brasilianum TaxID=104259 RepID=A0A0F7TKF7_PENBI|nr:hypothetical protein PMG11_01733 [Penicillium brasilianum]